MESLTLNDGTVITGHLIETNERLFLYMKEITMQEAFNLLIKPENTTKIRAVRYRAETTVHGYQALYSISNENGQICAMLKKN